MEHTLTSENTIKDYGWKNTEGRGSSNYIAPAVITFLKNEKPLRVLDLGCGNGSLCNTINNTIDTHLVGID